MSWLPDPADQAPLPRFADFEEFWGFYLGEHRRVACRVLHYLGAMTFVFLVWRAVLYRSLACALCALPAAYALAWFGHIMLERNRPATWRHPLWSLRAELRMCMLAVTGRLSAELRRFGIH